MILRALILVGLLGCDVEDTRPPEIRECRERVCSALASCAPIIPGNDWDWRTEESCKSSMTCGDDVDGCEDAVLNLRCIGPGATLWFDKELKVGVYNVWHACSVNKWDERALVGGRSSSPEGKP